MDQIAGNPQGHDEDASAWKYAHQRLSQMLMDRVEPFGPLVPIMKLDAAGYRGLRPPVLSAYCNDPNPAAAIPFRNAPCRHPVSNRESHGHQHRIRRCQG